MLTVSLAKVMVAKLQQLTVVLVELNLVGTSGGKLARAEMTVERVDPHAKKRKKYMYQNCKQMVFHKLMKCMELEANTALSYPR